MQARPEQATESCRNTNVIVLEHLERLHRRRRGLIGRFEPGGNLRDIDVMHLDQRFEAPSSVVAQFGRSNSVAKAW